MWILVCIYFIYFRWNSNANIDFCFYLNTINNYIHLVIRLHKMIFMLVLNYFIKPIHWFVIIYSLTHWLQSAIYCLQTHTHTHLKNTRKYFYICCAFEWNFLLAFCISFNEPNVRIWRVGSHTIRRKEEKIKWYDVRKKKNEILWFVVVFGSNHQFIHATSIFIN